MTRTTAAGLVAVTATAVLLILSSCGGDDGGDATATPSAHAASPSAALPASDQQVIDLAGVTPLMKITPKGEGDIRSDIPGAATGDFNGDGIDDLALGARFADPDGREDAGEVYLVLGSAELPAQIDLGSDDPDLTIRGASAGGGLGFSVLLADLDNDGKDELIAGAPFAGTGATNERNPGMVFIVAGREDPPSSIDLASETPDTVINGPSAAAYLGDSLAFGDVNGDGTHDLVVGATFAHQVGGDIPEGPQAGAAYVFYGTEDWPESINTAAGEYGAALKGEEHLDEVGDTVAAADLNNDGFDDIIATAEAADGPDNARSVAAEVTVLAGDADLSGDHIVGQDEMLLRIHGAEQNDTVGFDLAAGDLDGDGIDDLAMTARLASGPANLQGSAGEGYVLFGSPDLPTEIDLLTELAAVASFHAPDSGDLMGRVMIGRLGRETVLVFAAAFGDGPDNSRADAGDIFVLRSAQTGSFSSVKDSASIVYYGAAPQDRSGMNAVTGDLNGDGSAELIVVSPDADASASQIDFGVVSVLASGP
jgi:hypothetical protein